jgi:putative acetyltransferase
MPEIVTVTAPGTLLDRVRELIVEYQQELGENLSFQNTAAELEDPLLKYGPPAGCLLLALQDGAPAGCVALQPLNEPGVCEMKRLFVRPAFRQYHIGNALVQAIISEARNRAYTVMVLDTLERLQPAIRLYRQAGFIDTAPYYPNPLRGVVYFRKEL